MGCRLLVGVFALGACGTDAITSTTDEASTVCGAGPTVNGMDVSYYDDSVDWARAKAAGIDFAFIRVTDGTQYRDPKFGAYWDGAKAAGVIRGAYQFFRPAEDPIAQADLLLSLMGPLEVGDLPPVLDVEVSGSLPPSEVAANVHTWIDHVTERIGRAPIVYAGLYSWPELTGATDVTSSPLWLAQYTTAACPNIPAPWTRWMFWQHSDTGQVDGVVSQELDLNVFDGTLEQLKAFAIGQPCGTIAADGGVIDDSDACFTPGGPTEYMRHVTDAGMGDSLYWTHTTTSAAEANYGQWNLSFAAAGRYHVEAYTSAVYATSHAASYLVHAAGGETAVQIDQTAVDGWQALGDFTFAAGADQWINLGDNTGEATQEQLVFDAIRVTPVAGTNFGSDATPPEMTAESGGCSTTRGSTAAFAFGLVLALRRRRRV